MSDFANTVSSEVPIPDAAIEAMERMWPSVWLSADVHVWRDKMRLLVEAAAPLIVAAAYDRAAREYEGLAIEFEHRAENASDGPKAAGLITKSEVWKDAAEDLRGRASVLRGEGQTDAE